MKRNNSLNWIVSGLLVFLASCSDFEAINKNPNSPEKVPTQSLIAYVERSIVDEIRSTNLSIGRSDLYVQWLANNTYTDADRYYWISSNGNDSWKNLYLAQSNLDEIIRLNVDEATKAQAAQNGDNNNQIAVARILKVFTYQVMTDTWGDIPYSSFGGSNATFDAGKADQGVIYAQYAKQELIYADLLKELKEASDQLNTGSSAFASGDAIYKGNALKWKKFANSLSLRIANRVRNKLNEADNRIKEILANPAQYPIFESNDDNALLAFETNAPNQAPFYKATTLANRNDYAVSNVFVDFLQGKKAVSPVQDPRLSVYAQPNSKGNYVGQYYGMDMFTASLVSPDSVSKPGAAFYKSDYKEVLMEYAEVQFILSEYKNWDQQHYLNGIRASMQKWGISNTAVDSYLQSAPPASQETVLTQKWVALFMQGNEGWAEYRRTGYPNFLIKAGDIVWKGTVNGQPVTKTFEPIGISSVPSRLLYPNNEVQLNSAQYQKAAAQQGGDQLDTKIWWNK